MPSELFALSGGRDQQVLAVLGDGPSGDFDALPAHLIDNLLVRHRILLVFLGDDLEELLLDRVPGDFVTVGRLRAAAEKALEREDPAWRLNPLIVDCPA